MFTTFFNDWSSMPNNKFTVKYILPFLIVFFSALLTGQLIVQFMDVGQLNKTSGKILDLQTMVTGHQMHRSIPVDTYTPIYSLVIGLDNLNSYNIETDQDRQNMGEMLHKGDSITIYYPTTAMKILSTGFFHRVSQIERNRQVIYSFKHIKEDNYIIIGMYTAIMVLIVFARMYMIKYII